MNIDPVNLAMRSAAEGPQKILDELVAELAVVKARRDKLSADIWKAEAAAEKGDKRQLFALAALNKQDQEEGRLVISIGRQIAEEKKRLGMAANQFAAMRANVVVPIAAGPERLFLVNTPHDRRQVRHRARTIEALRARLLPGYVVEGEIFGANDAGEGGVVAAIEPKGPSIMSGLLEAHGLELLAFLAEHGVKAA